MRQLQILTFVYNVSLNIQVKQINVISQVKLKVLDHLNQQQ